MGVYPPSAPTNWCGEYQAKLKESEAERDALVKALEEIVDIGTQVQTGPEVASESELLRAYGRADAVARAALAAVKGEHA